MLTISAGPQHCCGAGGTALVCGQWHSAAAWPWVTAESLGQPEAGDASRACAARTAQVLQSQPGLLENRQQLVIRLARLLQCSRCVQGRGTGAADRLRLQQAQVCAPEAPAGASAAAAAAAAAATSKAAAAAAAAACARLQAAAAARAVYQPALLARGAACGAASAGSLPHILSCLDNLYDAQTYKRLSGRGGANRGHASASG